MVETRRFGMHSKLLMDVIKRQAGSLSKAILEAVMNAVDAKATRVAITADLERVQVVDDGHGFQSRQAIEQYFEVFGQPHDEGEGKTYGTFRMGRGQLFAYGHNRWVTGAWEMDVDIDRRGLDYDLHERTDSAPGCRITIDLYEPLVPGGLVDLRRDLERWCKWAPIPVEFNGAILSQEPAQAKWDHVTDEAYIRLKQGGNLAIYNLGIFVMDQSPYKFGCGGEIVSRKPVRVNFARNDIQSTCPVWRKITPLLTKEFTQRTARRPTLDEAARQRLIDLLLRGETDPAEADRHRLLTAVNGRHLSIRDFRAAPSRRFSVAPAGDRVAGRVMDQGLAIVLSHETLERWGVQNATDLLATLEQLFGQGAFPTFVPFETLREGYTDDHTLLPPSDLTPKEEAWLALAQTMSLWLGDAGSGAHGQTRKVRVGQSDTLDGWTDGQSFIAISRPFLGRKSFNVQGLTDLGLLLAHEFVHQAPNVEGCDHDADFYEAFHQKATASLALMTSAALRDPPGILERAKIRVSRTMLRDADRAAHAGQVAKALDATPRTRD